MVVHCEPRARTKEIKKLVKPALLEREREYKIIWNYQIISYLFFLLSSINELDTAIAWRTPLFCKVLRLLKLKFIACIIVINL